MPETFFVEKVRMNRHFAAVLPSRNGSVSFLGEFLQMEIQLRNSLLTFNKQTPKIHTSGNQSRETGHLSGN